MRRCLSLLVVALCSVLALAQRRQLSIEWAIKEGPKVASVPNFVWLKDGTAILYDTNKPEAERTFELLNPATGERHPVLNMAAAVVSLKKISPDAGVEKALDWPKSFDDAGKQALYEIKGDVYVLTLADATFVRITNTPAEENDAQFSPDGQLISFVRDNDLYVHDLASRKETRLTNDGSENSLNGTLTWVYWEEVFGRKDMGYWWSPDSKSIAYLHTDTAGVPVSTFVDFEPQDPKVIHQVYPKAGEKDPTVKVGVMSVAGPRTQWISIPEQFEWLLRVKWLPDSKRVAVETMNRMQTELRLYFANADSGEAKHILTETDHGWVNETDDLYFLHDGQHFLWASERDGYMHLYRFAMDGKLVNKVTNGDWAMASSGGVAFWVRQAVTGIDEKNDWIYFTAMKDSSIERQLYRVKTDGRGLQRLSETTGTHGIEMSPDTRFYFDTFSDIHTPPSLILHASDGKRIATLAAPKTDLLPEGMVYPELTTIPTADGFPMPASILKPANFDPQKKYPVILYIYGGPSAPVVANEWDHAFIGGTYFDNIMARNGYVMVRIDNRAATAFSKKLEDLIGENPAAGETADLVDGVRWLKRQSWVDASRFGVWGWSGGGTNTLNLMTRSKEFKAGIAGAPVTDWHYYDSKWSEAFMKTPQANPQGYEKTSLVKRAGDLSGDLLIMYGTYDDNVHPQNEEAFMNALIAAGKPYRTEVYPMRKHGFTDDPARIHREHAMEDFWKSAL
jgi:dipeptidyl-peptidase-4